MKVNEVFYSLQGEGRWTGTPAVFLRLAGCNLRCPFCDTVHDPYREMALAEIVEAALAFPSRLMVLTGGEPTLQLSSGFLEALVTAGFSIHLETNGTIPLPPFAEEAIDWVTCSPKTPVPALKRIDELKVVYDLNSVPEMFLSIPITNPECRYLQPCDTGSPLENDRILSSCINYIKCNPQWKLSLQTHKLINIK